MARWEVARGCGKAPNGRNAVGGPITVVGVISQPVASLSCSALPAARWGHLAGTRHGLAFFHRVNREGSGFHLEFSLKGWAGLAGQPVSGAEVRASAASAGRPGAGPAVPAHVQLPRLPFMPSTLSPFPQSSVWPPCAAPLAPGRAAPAPVGAGHSEKPCG